MSALPVILAIDQGTTSSRCLAFDAAGAVVDEGTYWLSTAPDVIDWSSSTWYNTPCSAWASFADLRSLAAAPLGAHTRQLSANVSEVTISVPPSQQGVVFLVRARLLDGTTGAEFTGPVLWDRNFIVLLLAGENVTLTARYDGSSLSAPPVAAVTSFNDVVPR